MEPTMLAGRLNVDSHHFEVRQVPVPLPGPGEVRVRVEAAGVCLSDVHLVQGLLRPLLLHGDEVTLGHEVAGTVEMLGDHVITPALGTRVVVLAGREIDGVVHTMGVDYDGGWAEYVVVPAPLLVTIPDTLSFDEAAIVPDAVSTPWAAITTTAAVRPGQAVGVWGVGELGVHAVQLLRFVGAAPIIAIDPVPQARERALALGADAALDPGADDFAAQVQKITGGRGLAFAFDFAGVDAVRQQAITSLGAGGVLILVGLSGTPITIAGSSAFSYRQQQIRGHYGSSPHHIIDLVRLVALGRLNFSRSISATIPLADAADAIGRLERKEGNPIRLVLRPS